MRLPLQAVQRRFYLYRHTDHTGVSGAGTVALGVQFPDGTCVLRWLSQWRSTVVWADLAGLEAVHGHDGATTVIWLDDAAPGTT